MQINATLVKGKARVQFGANKVKPGSFNLIAPFLASSCVWLTSPPVFQNQYNLARAQQSYKSLVQIHEKNGECAAVKLWFRWGSLGWEESVNSSQVGTHHLKRMDKQAAPLCTEDMSLGQSILFLWSIYPFSGPTGDASSSLWATSFFCGSSDKYFSALLQERLYSGVTGFFPSVI